MRQLFSRPAAEKCAASANLCSLHGAFYINCTEAEKDEQVELLIACMDQACEDTLGKQVKIPVEAKVYDAREGYHDSRAGQIDAMLKKVLKDRNQAVAVAENGAK